MGADVAGAEEASDEVMAAIAAGGTYSFVPEPDEDEPTLPGEAELPAEDLAEALLAGEPPAPAEVEEAVEAEPRSTKPRSRKAAAAAVEPTEATAEGGPVEEA
jgi:hypothetical protein